MYIDDKKKVLVGIGIEQNLECFFKQYPSINLETIIVLESYGPLITHPFDDLMRDILIAVYQENVEEIFVFATKDDQMNSKDLLHKIYEDKGIQEKIKILDYLFENCVPELPKDNIRKWLEGSHSLMDDVQNTIDIIRHHPLMPSYVKVTELLIDRENEKIFET